MKNLIDIYTSVLFALVFIVFIVLTRKTRTFKNFAVSDNSIGLFLIFLSFSATFIGPGFSMALVNQGFNTGLFYMFIAGSYGIAKIVEGAVFAPKIRSRFSNALSIGDIIAGKESHNSKLLHLLTGLVSFGLLIGFSTVLSKAGGEVMNSFFGISKPLGITIMTGIVVVYSFFGGIKATIITDAFQFILFTSLIFILFISFFLNGINIEQLSLNVGELTSAAIAKTNISQYIGLISTWFLGEMLIPPTINRILSTKSKSVSKRGLIYSGIFMIIWLFIMLYIGAIINTILPDSKNSEQLLLVIAQQKLKFGLFGIFAVAIVGIVMSSQDSLINSASVIFTNDIFSPFKNMDDTQKLYLARLSTLVVGGFSIVFALYMPSILSGLLLIYSLWAPAILTPLIASIILKKGSSNAAIASMVTGISTSLIWRNLSVNEVIPSIIAGLFFSILSYLIVFKLIKR